MGRKNIHKYSPGFHLLLLSGKLYHRFFYRRFKVIGRENIPRNTPVIFTANHQNGLMDPVAIIYSARQQIVFFARADIFRRKFIARLLYFIKTLPIYRTRDGFRSVEQNRKMFEEAITVLENERAVGMFPEGNHEGKKRIRRFRKGAARLALKAEEKAGFELGLQLVPVGIDYSNYFNAGSDLIVVFGKPIGLKRYMEAYFQNPPRAIAQVTKDLSANIDKLIINIEPEGAYECIWMSTEVYFYHLLKDQKAKSKLYDSFLSRRSIIEKMNLLFKANDEKCNTLIRLASELREKLNQNSLHVRTISKALPNLSDITAGYLTAFTLLPVYLYGMVLNYLPYKLPSYFARNVRDKHLHVSVRFGAGFFTFGLWYLVLGIATCFSPVTLMFKALFLVSLPFSGLLTLYYYRGLLKLSGRWRWFQLRRRNKEEYERIIIIRNEITEIISDLMK